jgi:hypothetical protein
VVYVKSYGPSRNPWDAPWAPDPAYYHAHLYGEPDEPEIVADTDDLTPEPEPLYRTTPASARAAIANATGVLVPERTPSAYIPPMPPYEPYADDPEPTYPAPTPVAVDLRADEAAAATRVKRNARDRAKRLRVYVDRIRHGERPSGPKPRGK